MVSSLSLSKLKMEEELKKRSTDCVYFLASPLTCKKGIDCEFRHNEVARLNPRDCWYWLSGNCINPTCGFRHPPVDGHMTEAPSESASLPCQSSVPVNKTGIPCYFYFNGFCNKGDRCFFLHGPDGSASAGKSSKAAAASNDAHSIRSAPAEIHPNPSKIPLKQAVDTKVREKNDLMQSCPRSIPQRSDSPMISLSGCEEDVVINSYSMEPIEGFVKNKSHLYTDWSLEDQVNDHIEPEEWRESSPGFDVLVENDDTSENLGYEVDPKCLLAINREQRELNCHVLGYDFEDPIEYDPMYPDDTHNYLVNQHILDDFRDHPSHSRGRILDSILSRKRLLPLKLALDDHKADLRDHLRKRRLVDWRSVIHSSRRQKLSCLIGQKQEWPQTRVIGGQPQEKLASELGKNQIESHRDKGTFSKRANCRGWPRLLKSNVLRQRYREKRRASRLSDLSVISGEPFSRERISSQISSTFAGPKTLAEIKEEKKKVEEIGNCFGKMGNLTRTWVDFKGPKPLSEILEEKRRLLHTLHDGGYSS